MINYIGWYGFAVLATLLVWRKTTQVTAYWKKALIRTGVISFGFTTIPIMSPDGGAVIPIGIYFLSRSSWLAAAGTATVLIGVVWASLFTMCVVAPCLWSRMADKQWLVRQIVLSVIITIPFTIVGAMFLRLSVSQGSDLNKVAAYLLLFPNVMANLFAPGSQMTLFVFAPEILGVRFALSALLQLLYYFVFTTLISVLLSARRERRYV